MTNLQKILNNKLKQALNSTTNTKENQTQEKSCFFLTGETLKIKDKIKESFKRPIFFESGWIVFSLSSQIKEFINNNSDYELQFAPYVKLTEEQKEERAQIRAYYKTKEDWCRANWLSDTSVRQEIIPKAFKSNPKLWEAISKKLNKKSAGNWLLITKQIKEKNLDQIYDYFDCLSEQEIKEKKLKIKKESEKNALLGVTFKDTKFKREVEIEGKKTEEEAKAKGTVKAFFKVWLPCDLEPLV